MLNAIRTVLGMEVKLEQIVLENGVTLESETFEPGAPVFVVAEEERLPLPIGEYEMPGGSVLVVQEEGVIAEMRAPMPEQPAEEEMEAELEEEPKAKKVVESVTKETHFSAEDFLTKLSEDEALLEKLSEVVFNKLEGRLETYTIAAQEKEEVEEEKQELSEQKKEEPKKVELEVKKHDPEAKTKVRNKKISFKKPQTLRDRVLSKIG